MALRGLLSSCTCVTKGSGTKEVGLAIADNSHLSCSHRIVQGNLQGFRNLGGLQTLIDIALAKICTQEALGQVHLQTFGQLL